MLKNIATVKERERERELTSKEYSFINNTKKYIKYRDIKIRMDYNLKELNALSYNLSFLRVRN